METDLSLIEIGGADDSLLQDIIKPDQIKINPLDLDSSSVNFTCSPLLRSEPYAKPPPVPQIALNDKDERMKQSSLLVTETNNKENVSEDKLITPNSTKEQSQVKRRKVGFNLRKSLAWNKAFFTEEGVLDPVELSRLAGSVSNSKGGFLSSVSEERTKSLLKESKLSSGGSNLKELEKKLFDELPSRASKEDLKDVSQVPKAARRVHLVKNANRTASQGGGSLRPSGPSSNNNPPSTSVRSASMKDSKLPKFLASKSESTSASTTSKMVVGAKRSHCSQNTPTVNLAKNGGTKGPLINTKFTLGCTSSTAKASLHRSGKSLDNSLSGRRLSTNHHPQLNRATTSGSKVIPEPSALLNKNLPTGDTGSGRALVSRPQSGHYVGGNISRTQAKPAKPSGLRMPSPSLGYFAQPKVSASANIQSPKDTESSHLHDSSIPTLRKSTDKKHISGLKPPKAPAMMARVPIEGTNAMSMKCSFPSSTNATLHSVSKSGSEVQNLQFDRQKQLHALHENVREQYGQQVEMKKHADDEVEYISDAVNQQPQLNANKLIVQSGSLELNGKDDHPQIVKTVKPDVSRTRVEVAQGPPLLNFEASLKRGEDSLIERQHREGVQESFEGKSPVDNHELNYNEVISEATSPLKFECQVYGALGTSNIVKHQYDIQESLERNLPNDNEELDLSEREISKGASVLNSEPHSGADDLIEHHHGEEIDKILRKNTSVYDKKLCGNGVQLSEVPSLLDFGTHGSVLANNFSELQQKEGADKLLKANSVCDNQELNETARALNFDKRDYGVSGTNDLIKLLHAEELHESSKCNIPVNHELHENGTEMTEASPLPNSGACVDGYADNWIDNQHEGDVQEPLKASPPIDDLRKHQHGEEVHESSRKDRTVYTEDLNKTGTEISEASLLLDSEARVYEGADHWTEHQHGAGIQESLKKTMSGTDDFFEHQHGEGVQELLKEIMSGTNDFIKHQHGGEVHESQNRRMPLDNQELDGSGVEISEASLSLNSKTQNCYAGENLTEHECWVKERQSVIESTPGTDDPIKRQCGEEVHESQSRNRPLVNQELDGSVVEVSEASLLLNSKRENYHGGENLTEHEHLEDVQESVIANTPGTNNLIKHQHWEEVHESQDRNTPLHNQESHGIFVKISEASPVLNSKIQTCEGGENSTENQHSEEVQESLLANTPGADDLTKHQTEELENASSELHSSVGELENGGSSVGISETSPFLNSGVHVCGEENNSTARQHVEGVDNLIEHQHAGKVPESSIRSMLLDNQGVDKSEVDVLQASLFVNTKLQNNGSSGADYSVEYQCGEEVSSTRYKSFDNQVLVGSEGETSRRSLVLNSEMQVYEFSGADNSVEHLHKESVQESIKRNIPLDNLILNGVNNLIEHYEETEHNSSKRNTSIDIVDFNQCEVKLSGALSLLNTNLQVCSVSGADVLVDNWQGEELQESPKGNILVDNQNLSASEVKSSQTSPLLYAGMQVHGVAEEDTFNEQQLEEEVREVSKQNISVGHEEVNESEVGILQVASLLNSEMQAHCLSEANNSIEHEHGERSGQSFGGNRSDNQELHVNEVEISEPPRFLNSESQLQCGLGENNLVEHQQREEDQESSGRNTSDNDHDITSGIQFGDAIDNGRGGAAMAFKGPVVAYHDDNRHSREQAELEMAGPYEAEKLENIGNNVMHKSYSIAIKHRRPLQESPKCNDLEDMHVISESGDSCRMKEQLEEQAELNPIRNESEAVHHNENCSEQIKNSVLSQVISMLQVKSVTADYDIIMNAQVEGSEVGSLSGTSSVKNPDLFSHTQSRGTISDRNQSSWIRVGDNLDEQPGEQAGMRTYIPGEVEQIMYKSEDNKLLKKCISEDVLLGNGPKNVSGASAEAKSTDHSLSKSSVDKLKSELENVVSPKGNSAETLPDDRNSLDDSKVDALSIKHKLTAVPFSDEWLAALEAAGEDILTLKTGPVQNSPPDKSLPEPGPWSPVKRKNNQEIGPFDCTKCTNRTPPHVE